MRRRISPDRTSDWPSHLSGTYHLLNKWQCDADVCKAGLLHSVLGTPGLPHALLADNNLRDLIGQRAVLLVRLFSSMELQSLLKIVAGDRFSDSGGRVVRL